MDCQKYSDEFSSDEDAGKQKGEESDVMRTKQERNSILPVGEAFTTLNALVHTSSNHTRLLSVKDIMKICSPSDVPGKKGNEHIEVKHSVKWLRKMLGLNFETRDNDVPALPSEKPLHDSFDDDEDDDQFFSDEEEENYMHPADNLLLIYMNCDMSLKQLLVRSMFLCRLAVPLIIPNYVSGNYEICLQSLANVTLESMSSEGQRMECSAKDAKGKMVSFIRIGQNDSVSKSSIINCVLDATSRHPTFITWECKNANQRKALSNGMVELSWMLPKRGSKQSGLTTILNLRGDAVDYPGQLNVLTKMSHVIVVFLESINISTQPKLMDTLKAIPHNVPMVILLSASDKNIPLKSFKRDFDTESRRCKLQKVLPRTNVQHIADKLCENLDLFLKDATNSSSLNELANLTEWRCDLTQFKDEQLSRDQIMKNIDSFEMHELKHLVFRLQGRPWHDWSALKKQYYRNIKLSDGETEQKLKIRMRDEMAKHREEQANMLTSQPSAVTDSFTILNKTSGESRNQFYGMLSHALNERCRLILPKLYAQYRALVKQQQLNPENSAISSQIPEMEKRILDSSIGIEHIFREMGQTFEAEKSHIKTGLYDYLPELAASLLVDGHPLELLDGDAGNMPIEWVKTVFEHASCLLCDKKILILSVLGIQSSGKSTLLNTMFGLQFAVSAGRCTRGVFMQLIETDGSMPVDYVLVLDTEGLRAQELGECKDRDNELATFVIGVADVILINIKGENYSEMKDVIQIAVHAFFRMTQVSSNFNSNKRCIFLHQNSPAANAKSQNDIAGKKLQEALDDMACEAASQQNVQGFKSFNQIINFESERDIWFFPDLWQGSPPMSHVNPDYSKEALNIRSDIFHRIALKQSNNFKSVTEFSKFVYDLWYAILQEDFVFSFRNCLEIRASNLFDHTCRQLFKDYQGELAQWENDFNAKTAIENDKGDINLLASQLDLNEKQKELKNKYVTELEKFCANNPNSEVMRQWLPAKKAALEHDIDRNGISCDSRISNSIEKRKQYLQSLKSEGNVKVKLRNRSRELAEKNRESKLPLKDITTEFDNIWSDMNKHHTAEETKLTTVVEKVRADVERVLLHLLPSQTKYINAVLESKMYPFELTDIDSPMGCEWARTEYTDDDLSVLNVKSNETYEQKNKEWSRFCEVVTGYIRSDVYNHLTEKCIKYLQGEQTYNPIKIIDLLENIKAKWERGLHEEDSDIEIRISLLPPLQAELAVWGCQLAFPALCKVYKVFTEKHNYLQEMKEYRRRMLDYFINTVQQKEEENNIAIYIKDELKDIVRPYFKENVVKEITAKFIKVFKENKAALLSKSLSYIANPSSDFAQLQYVLKMIDDPFTIATFWLKDFTSRMYREEKPQSNIASDIYLKLDSSLHATTKVCRDSSPISPTFWHSEFYKNVRKLLPGTAEKVIRECPFDETEVISDVDSFQEQFDSCLKDIVKDFQETPFAAFNDICTELWYRDVLRDPWGCAELCPFCKQPCKHPTGHTGNHESDVHIPMGLAGFTDKKGRLHTIDCGDAVSDPKYEYQVEGRRWWIFFTKGMVTHKFKSYKKRFSEWNIAEYESNGQVVIWKSLFAKYAKDLANHHKARPPKTASDWIHYKIDTLIDIN